MNKKKYLITGGTGFIGSAFVIDLVKDNHSVRVLDDNSRGDVHRLEEVENDIEFVNGDIRSYDDVMRACKGIDSVFHFAYINGTEFFYTKPELVLDVAVKGIVNVLDACIEHGIKEFFLASSSEVYQTPPVTPTDETCPLIVPDPMNPRFSYGGGKIISELMTINYGRKHFDRVIIFRPHNVYGPDMGWEHVIPQFIVRMKEICESTNSKDIEFPIQGSGWETRAFIFISDFIDGLRLLMEKGEHLNIYHIGNDEEVSVQSVAVEIGNFFEKNINIVSGESTEGSTSRRCPDISKLKKLGFIPEVNLKEGLPIAARWYIDHANEKPVK
jgi:nucleoside-diphosphate-sugar epimerase